MSFLVPSALVGLSLLAIPIIVHLLRPRRMRPTEFSSLRWLRETPQRASRRVQWHQWPLFLLRASIIILLVAALAKPLLDFSRERKGASRVIVLDISSSMGRDNGDEPTPLARAKDEVLRLAANNRSSDRLTILAVGGTPRIILPATHGPILQIASLASLEPEAASADLAAALPLVRMLLDEGDADCQHEVIFVTDNLQNRWNQGEIQTFVAEQRSKLAARIIDVSPSQRANDWIADARPSPARDGGDALLRVIVRSVGEELTPRRLRWITGDGPGEHFAVSWLADGIGMVDVPLPGAQQNSNAGELRLEPADAHPADDSFFVSLDARPALRALIIEPETGIAGRSSGTHWREALTALSTAGSPIEVVERTTRELTAEDVQSADQFLLAGVAELSDAIVSKLEARVRAGAGLVVCVGPAAQLDFYNQKLHRQLQPNESLLPVALAVRGDAAGSDAPTLLTRLDWQHPLLATLADPVQSDFADSQFLLSMNITDKVGASDAVLAWYDNGSPAIIEHPLGAGRILLLNTSADDAWTDLPRRKCFVPFVDRVLAYLAPGGRGLVERRAGNPFRIMLPPDAKVNHVTIIGPGGEAVPFMLVDNAGEKAVRVERAAKPGIYRLEVKGQTIASVAVQGDRSNSALIESDADALRQWWSPAKFEIVSAQASAANVTSQSTWPIWPWLVLAAGILLVAEQICVTRLCPRATPPAPALLVRVPPSSSNST